MPAPLLAGVGLCVGASTLTSLGLIVMKMVVSRDEAELIEPLDLDFDDEAFNGVIHVVAEEDDVDDDDAHDDDDDDDEGTNRDHGHDATGKTRTPLASPLASPLTPTSPRRVGSPRRSSSFFDDLVVTKDTSIRVIRLTNLRWGGGLLLFIAGQLLNLVALSFLSEVSWAVLSLFSLVANALFASAILGEAFTRHDLLCTALILVGSACVVISNSSAVSRADLELDSDPASASSSSSSFSSAPAFMPTHAPVEKGAERESAGDERLDVLLSHFSRPWFLSYGAFLLFLLLTSVGHGVRSLGHGHRVQALTWTVFSGTCGSVSVLLGKCLAEMAGAALGGAGGLHGPVAARVLGAPSTYAILGVFVAAAAASLLSLTMALAVGEALLVVPWLTVTNTLLAILGGVFYFEDLSSLQSVGGVLLFISGVVLAVLGAWFLQAGRERQKLEHMRSHGSGNCGNCGTCGSRGNRGSDVDDGSGEQALPLLKGEGSAAGGYGSLAS